MTSEPSADDVPLDLSNEPPVAMPEPARFVGTFDDLDIVEGVRKGLRDLGYTGPTPVQREVFLPLRAGNDALVQAKTGSGKTTAFALPTLCAIDPAQKSPQAIILCPTRELALQVSAETARLGHPAGIKVVTIYGGASMRAQIDALQSGVHVVVGTPGRVKDLHRQGQLRFEGIRVCILDEADEMLSRGFWDEVTSILDQLPDELTIDGVKKPRQTALFSATLPDQIERAAHKYLRTPTRINLSTDTLNVSTIRHVLHHENEKWSKPRNFLYMVELHKPTSAIVFCNRKDETEMICSYVKRFGYRAEALNGDMPQSARERTLAKVKAGELDLMIATDVAARGIDISDLGHVFNYDLPEHDEIYVHRVGRTGRIGKRGTAASLVRGKYLAHLTSLKKQYKVPFEEVALPDEKELLWMQAERLAVQILEDASGVEMEQYRPIAEALMGRGDVKEIIAFLLRTHYAQGVRAPSPSHARDEGRARGFDGPRGDGPRGDGPPRGDRGDRPDRGPRPERSGDRPDRGPRADGPRTDGPRTDGPPREPRGDGPRTDGPPREPRADRPAGEAGVDGGPEGDVDGDEVAPISPTVNLYVTIGRHDGVADLMALTRLLAEMSGVDDAHFTGAGDVRDHSSHLEVDAEVADKIVTAVHGKARPAAAGAPTHATAPELAGEGPPSDGPPAEVRTIVCERAKTQPGDRRRRPGGGGGGEGRGRGGERGGERGGRGRGPRR